MARKPAAPLRAVVGVVCVLLAHTALAGGLLPEFTEQALRNPQTARAALQATQAERGKLAPQWRARERACFERYLVEACRAEVLGERRAASTELDGIDRRARATLRHEAAIEKSRKLAERLVRDTGSPVENPQSEAGLPVAGSSR